MNIKKLLEFKFKNNLKNKQKKLKKNIGKN